MNSDYLMNKEDNLYIPKHSQTLMCWLDTC